MIIITCLAVAVEDEAKVGGLLFVGSGDLAFQRYHEADGARAVQLRELAEAPVHLAHGAREGEVVEPLVLLRRLGQNSIKKLA